MEENKEKEVLKYLKNTLKAGETTIIFVDELISQEVVLQVKTENYIFPKDMKVSGNIAELIFEEQEDDLEVTLEIFKYI